MKTPVPATFLYGESMAIAFPNLRHTYQNLDGMSAVPKTPLGFARSMYQAIASRVAE
ncbi:MAG: hypothetical protein IGR76_00660 [Synechococcales cyanobacterium T60_A2020_003]|nr:hypothetical protein [Synechococcales cyanobacterium T60_A2020_003]